MGGRSNGAVVRETTFARTDALRLGRAWLVPFCLGIAGYVLNDVVKLPIQLPGHNALFWIVGLALGRLLSGNQLGGMVGGAGTIVGAFGRDPLEGAEIAAAGIVLDLLVALRPLTPALSMPLAGALANLSVFGAKLLVGDVPNAVITRGAAPSIVSYAVFGALSGGIAALLASSIRIALETRTARERSHEEPRSSQ